MDDLFRQAADQYPLRTGGSDWNRLANALDANPSLLSPQGVEQTDNRRRRRVLWLLLLPLMAGGLGYYAWRMPAARKGVVGITSAKALPAENGVAGSNNGVGGLKNGMEGSNTTVAASNNSARGSNNSERIKMMESYKF